MLIHPNPIDQISEETALSCCFKNDPVSKTIPTASLRSFVDYPSGEARKGDG
jgi:hypothetical protein